MRTDGAYSFYPVVPDAAWVRRLVACGVRTIQLRLKNMSEAQVRMEIQQAKAACRADTQFIVNDHWQEAIETGCSYVHLGQDDLAMADVAALRRHGLRLGISTHSPDELDAALSHAPDYIALGPVYPTTLKKMPWAPQGVERLRDWKKQIDCPLVAIGGMTLERAPEVFAAGADAIALVNDVVAHPVPEVRVRDWIDLCERSYYVRAA